MSRCVRMRGRRRLRLPAFGRSASAAARPRNDWHSAEEAAGATRSALCTAALRCARSTCHTREGWGEVPRVRAKLSSPGCCGVTLGKELERASD